MRPDSKHQPTVADSTYSTRIVSSAHMSVESSIGVCALCGNCRYFCSIFADSFALEAAVWVGHII
eukprot:scaffold266554_cov23-Tisochrysis_lutea.AAC.1